MFLSRFGVKNYKCLADIDIPLTPIHVLIGQNDAGKTSLLEALEAFYSSGDVPLAKAFPYSEEKERKLVFSGSGGKKVELSGEWTESLDEKAMTKYSITAKFAPKDQMACWVDREWFEVGGVFAECPPTESDQGRLRGLPNETIVCTHRQNRIGTGSSVTSEHEEYAEAVANLLGSAQMYSFQPKILATPATIDRSRAFRMDLDGFGLATLLDDIGSFEPELQIRLRKTFCRYFPQYANIRVLACDAVARHYDSSNVLTAKADGKGVFFELNDGTLLSAQQTSDGAVLFLAYLALAHLPKPPKLLLIEEPENGIYPQRLVEIITLLKKMVERTDGVPFPQIIMSTHSPYVLSMFEPEEVTFLSRRPDDPGGGVRARPMRDAPQIRERMTGGEFYLGELWYNLDEEELFGGP